MCTDQNLLGIIKVFRMALTVLQIAIPIILLLFGAVDLGKAVMAGDEKEIKSATTTLVKRAIAALAVFLLFMVVSTVTGWVGGDQWIKCWEKAADANINIGV